MVAVLSPWFGSFSFGGAEEESKGAVAAIQRVGRTWKLHLTAFKFKLLDNADVEQIKAELTNEILTVTAA